MRDLVALDIFCVDAEEEFYTDFTREGLRIDSNHEIHVGDSCPKNQNFGVSRVRETGFKITASRRLSVCTFCKEESTEPRVRYTRYVWSQVFVALNTMREIVNRVQQELRKTPTLSRTVFVRHVLCGLQWSVSSFASMAATASQVEGLRERIAEVYLGLLELILPLVAKEKATTLWYVKADVLKGPRRNVSSKFEQKFDELLHSHIAVSNPYGVLLLAGRDLYEMQGSTTSLPLEVPLSSAADLPIGDDALLTALTLCQDGASLLDALTAGIALEQ